MAHIAHFFFVFCFGGFVGGMASKTPGMSVFFLLLAMLDAAFLLGLGGVGR